MLEIPTAAEMNFPIELELIETNDLAGPFGAKGVGEPALVPTAAAIVNAIYDAVGVRIRHLPIAPETPASPSGRLRFSETAL